MDKHQILCVDDEAHNLEALERLLRRNYKVVTAQSGAEALEHLNHYNFSLIISDQKMPNMTGVEFFAQARFLQPDCLRILLTGYTDLESVIEAINQGQIYRYITKPWEPDELRTTIEQALELFELKKTVEKQNQDLRLANVALKSLDKLKSDFMMLVNHELKTPLTGIFSYVQLLSEESLSEDQRLYLDKVHKNTQRLQDLIDDTLLITRIKSDTGAKSSSQQDLAELSREIWKDLKTKAPKSSQELDIEPAHFEVTLHESNMRILLTKLMKNVLQHAAEGEKAQLAFKDAIDFWQLTISNPSAKALPQDPKELTKAFAKMGSMLNHSGGTGLGLAVTEAICKMHGGEMSLDTNNQTFRLEIRIPKDI